MNAEYRSRERSLIILLHVLLFYHGILCVDRWSSIAKSLYFHNLWAHFGRYYETSNFADSSTEEDEAWLATAKKTFKGYTDRKKADSSWKEVIVRWHNKRVHSPSNNRNRNDKEERHLQQKLVPSSFFLPLRIVHSPSVSLQWFAFLDHLTASPHVCLTFRDFQIALFNGEIGDLFHP